MKTLFLVAILMASVVSYAQNCDSIFMEVKRLAYAGNYNEAKCLINPLLGKSNNNQDWIRFKSSIYAWEQKYDSAITQLKHINNYQNNIEVNNLIALYQFRNKKFDEALKSCRNNLLKDSTNRNTLELEIEVLFQLKEYKRCLERIKRLTKKSIHLQNLALICSSKLYTKSLTLGSVNHLEKNSPNRSFYFGQLLKSRASWTFITSAQIEASKPTNNWQLQQEVYAKLGKKGYSNMSAGLMVNNSSKCYNISAVHFLPLKKRFEVDLGLRYYYCKSSTLVPSLGVSTSIDKIALNYRYYQVLANQTSGSTQTFSIKKSFTKMDEFLKMEFSIGNQLNQNNVSNISNLISSKGQSVLLAYARPVSPRIKAIASIFYNNTSINELTSIKRTNTTISLTYKF